MAIEKFRLGTNEDGTPLYHYHCPDGAVVVTGPNIQGTASVVHPDGTEFVYDINDDVTEVFPGHELHLAQAVADRFAAEGHRAHTDDVPFLATPVELTHDLETGQPREEFAAIVEEQAEAGRDSSPAAVLEVAQERLSTRADGVPPLTAADRAEIAADAAAQKTEV